MVFQKKKVFQGTREEVVQRLKVQFVSTIGTKGTLRGCSLNEAISDFRHDWSEELQDYVCYLRYGSALEMIEKELKGSVRIEPRDKGVRLCAVASPQLEHCFRLIDKTQPKERNRFASSLPSINSLNFPANFQLPANIGTSTQRFSRSQYRRPPAPANSGSVVKKGPRCLTPIYVRRKLSSAFNDIENGYDKSSRSSSASVSELTTTSTSFNNNNSGLNPPRRVPVAVRKEPWQVSKIESEISSSYIKIYDSMMSNGRRKPRKDPLMAEVEMNRNVDAPILDAVNREVYAKDDELNRSLDGHYFRCAESEATSSETSGVGTFQNDNWDTYRTEDMDHLLAESLACGLKDLEMGDDVFE